MGAGFLKNLVQENDATTLAKRMKYIIEGTSKLNVSLLFSFEAVMF